MNSLNKHSLFKKAKKGQILYWTPNVIHEVNNTKNSYIVVKFGMLNGAEQANTVVVSSGKNIGKANETSIETQAKLELQSMVNLKLDEGYKTLTDIELDIDPQEYLLNMSKLIQLLTDKLPDKKTDANGNLKPMLAQQYDEKKITFPAFVQPKLDGVRCLAKIEVRNNDVFVTLISRGGKIYNVPHLENELKVFAKEMHLSGTTIFDGEIYSPSLEFAQIVSAVKKNGDLTHRLKYYIYDMVEYIPMHQRKRKLDFCWNVLQPKTDLMPNIVFLNTNTVSTIEQIKTLASNWINEGFEGLIYRSYEGVYEHTRSSSLLKYKNFDSTEFKILNFELGARGVEDLLVKCVTNEGNIFLAKMKGDRESKKEIYDNRQEHFDKKITVQHFGWTNYALPRFPIGIVIRDYE